MKHKENERAAMAARYLSGGYVSVGKELSAQVPYSIICSQPGAQPSSTFSIVYSAASSSVS